MGVKWAGIIESIVAFCKFINNRGMYFIKKGAGLLVVVYILLKRGGVLFVVYPIIKLDWV